MPTWRAAGLWGLLAGGALIIGAALSFFVRVPKGLIAGVMAFGAGVSEQEAPGSGTAIAIGALLDGILESIVLRVTMIEGGAISVAALAAVFRRTSPRVSPALPA